ncbi:hypothetical protein CDD83_9491 [Cordyceps sp. RAO-2017]|nr:hypothetical protein CDD83_9491 [Cordyceps sp. RAO-2017]
MRRSVVLAALSACPLAVAPPPRPDVVVVDLRANAERKRPAYSVEQLEPEVKTVQTVVVKTEPVVTHIIVTVTEPAPPPPATTTAGSVTGPADRAPAETPTPPASTRAAETSSSAGDDTTAVVTSTPAPHSSGIRSAGRTTRSRKPAPARPSCSSKSARTDRAVPTPSPPLNGTVAYRYRRS